VEEVAEPDETHEPKDTEKDTTAKENRTDFEEAHESFPTNEP